MKLCLKITAGLLLLFQAFSLALLQETTDSTGGRIDQSWWRGFKEHFRGGLNNAVSEEENGGANAELSTDGDGIASGSMVNEEEEENVVSTVRDANESGELAVVTTTAPTDITTGQAESLNATVSSVVTTTEQTNSSNVNVTEAEEEFHNTTASPQTTTPDSNRTEIDTTTLAPEINATQETTTAEAAKSNSTTTEVANTTTTEAPDTTTTTPGTTNTTTVLMTTTLPDSLTSQKNPETTTTTTTTTITTTVAATSTTVKKNDTDKAAASGSDSDRGLAEDANSRRHSAWGAVFGTAVAVACVGLVAYVILRHKHQKGFSHRKLVEEFPSDPVLRLDNSEPLDLNFGGSAYYNPALQGDNIQMTNIPGRR